MDKAQIEQAGEARCIFQYDESTGSVTWRLDRGGRKAGSRAGTVHHNGYWVVRFQGKFHRLHRIIWLMTHGEWPNGVIDHINGDGLDNRISNLRVATVAQNQWNRVKPNNAVFWHSANSRWTVSLRVNGKLLHFGSFTDRHQADLIAQQAIKEHHGEFARV